MSFLEVKKPASNLGNDLTLIIDVRSSSIASSLVSIVNNKSKILFSHRKYVFFEKSPNPEEYVKAMLELMNVSLSTTLHVELANIASKYKKVFRVKYAHVFYTSPWYDSLIRNLNLENKKPTHFNQKTLEKLLAKDNEYTNEITSHALIDKKILSVSLNGYKTENPLKQKAKHIEVSFFSAFLSHNTKKDVENLINKFIKPHWIKHHTHLMPIMSAIQTFYKDIPKALILDISGEETDIAITEKGGLNLIANVPMGRNYFIREVKDRCSLDYHSALSKLKLINDSVLDDTCVAKVIHSIDQIENEWLGSPKDVLGKIPSLPSTIFIIGDSDMNHVWKNIFNKSKSYLNYLNLGKAPQLHLIVQDLENVLADNLYSKKDNVVSLLAFYASHPELQG